MTATIDAPTNGKGDVAAAADAIAKTTQRLATAGVPNAPELATVVTKVNKARDETKDVVVESDLFIDALYLAVLSGTHVYASGAGGVGKTFGAEELGKHFGVETYYAQFRPDTKREEVFGPLSMTKLQQDIYEHATKGYLPEAWIAVLDEFGDAGRFTRQLLNALHERWFVNGGVRGTIPLVTAIGTTNVFLDSEETAALMDRFAQRITVEPVKTSRGFKKILKGQLEREAGLTAKRTLTVIAPEELMVAREAVRICAVDAHIIDLVDDLRKSARSEGLEMSPRRWGEGLKLARANAVLNGRSDVTEDDLRVYANVLLNHPDDVKKARDLCKGFRDKLSVAAEEARTAVDDLKKLLAVEREKHGKGETVDFAALGNAHKQAEIITAKIAEAKATNGGRSNPDIDRIEAEIGDERKFMARVIGIGR
jgi:MoxR-like ATPase